MVDPTHLGPALEFAAGGTGLRLLYNVLGPSSKDFGAIVSQWWQSRLDNTMRITEKAARKLGPDIDTPGEIHPRVTARILEQGSWCDDNVMQEYLAGILASSRTEDGQDDAGAYWAELVTSLSSGQTRLHYAIYRSIQQLVDLGQKLGTSEERRAVMFTAPVSDYLSWEHDITGVTSPQAFIERAGRVQSDLAALQRETLVDQWSFQERDGQLRITAEPTFPGLQLLCRALGSQDDSPSWFTGHGRLADFVPAISHVGTATLTSSVL